MHFPLVANPKVIVIGAGLAGLTAAYRLVKKGFDVELYEARDRVGGRILTARVHGHIAELGAFNLYDGGEAKDLLELVSEMDLEISETNMTLSHHCFIDGELKGLKQQLEAKHFSKETLSSDLEEISCKCQNMKEVLLCLFDEEDPLYQIFSTHLAAYEGAVLENLSTCNIQTLYHMLLGGLSSVHEEESICLGSIKGGNALLTEKLAQKLNGRVHLKHLLLSVRKLGDQYELTFKDQEVKIADYLLLAIPCSVYKDIHFEEGVIPDKKLLNIQNIQYGTNAKILLYARSGDKRQFINDHLIAFYDSKATILTLYYTGEAGRFSSETIEEIYRRDSSQIEKGLEIPQISSGIAKFAEDHQFVNYQHPIGFSWPTDPYAKGSYSYIAPGQEALLTSFEEIEGETVKALFKPVDQRLFFAGEHTTVLLDVLGTMKAACESGEKAARMIEQAFLKKSQNVSQPCSE